MIMPTDFETFLATLCIWDFQDKCSSTITPKNKTSFTRSISISLIEKCKSSFCLFCFVLNRIKIWIFYVNRKLISLKPAWQFLQFVIHSFHQLMWVVMRKKYVGISSAKSMKSKAFDTLHKSLLYNNGPKIDPWGTPNLRYLEEKL